MSHRHSDSKRRHSKFDREPSPKRYRRDEKQERERDRDRGRVAVNDGDHNHKDWEQRNLPLPHHSREESADAAHKKSNSKDHDEQSKHSSQPPRSRSHFQHDERGSAGQLDRTAGRKEAVEKVFSQTKNNNERVEASQGRELTSEKSQAKLDDNLHRRDGLSERKDDPSPSVRKRPAFREKKIPVDSGDANPAVAVAVKPSYTDRSPERNERKMERSSDPRHQDRPERQIAEDRAPNKSEARRDGFSSRVRYAGNGGSNNYRGRGKFNGRQGYHPIQTQTEKWKHDLYQEVNKDPMPKNEDEQIAKLEALLAS